MPPPSAPASRSRARRCAGLVAGRHDRPCRGAAPESWPRRDPPLNRSEYANAIRDLLALNVDARSLLPADDADQEGFDNNAGVLSVSPALLERYMSAAQRISRLAVGDPTIVPGVRDLRDAEAADAGRPDERGSAVRIARRHRRCSISSRSTASTSSRSVCKRQLYDYIRRHGPSRISSTCGSTASGSSAFTIGGEATGKPAPATFVGNILGGSRMGRLHARGRRRPGGALSREGRDARAGRVVRRRA